MCDLGIKNDWANLPDVALLEIYRCLSDGDRVTTAQVCKNWNLLFETPLLWRYRCVSFGGFNAMESAERACRYIQRFGKYLRTLVIRFHGPTYRTVKSISLATEFFLKKLITTPKIQIKEFVLYHANMERNWHFVASKNRVVSVLCRFLRRCRQLEVLNLIAARLTLVDGCRIIEALGRGAAAKRLKYFYMEDMFQSNVTPVSISRYRDAMAKLSGISYLYTNYNTVDGSILRSFAKENRIEKLTLTIDNDINRCIIPPNEWSYFKYNCPSTKVNFYLYASGFRHTIHHALPETIPMSEIDIIAWPAIVESRLESQQRLCGLIHHIGNVYHESLESFSLHLDKHQPVDEEILYFLSRCQKIKHLSLYCKMTVNTVEKICEMQQNNIINLRSLNLGVLGLDESELRYLLFIRNQLMQAINQSNPNVVITTQAISSDEEDDEDEDETDESENDEENEGEEGANEEGHAVPENGDEAEEEENEPEANEAEENVEDNNEEENGGNGPNNEVNVQDEENGEQNENGDIENQDAEAAENEEQNDENGENGDQNEESQQNDENHEGEENEQEAEDDITDDEDGIFAALMFDSNDEDDEDYQPEFMDINEADNDYPIDSDGDDTDESAEEDEADDEESDNESSDNETEQESETGSDGCEAVIIRRKRSIQDLDNDYDDDDDDDSEEIPSKKSKVCEELYENTTDKAGETSTSQFQQFKDALMFKLIDPTDPNREYGGPGHYSTVETVRDEMLDRFFPNREENSDFPNDVDREVQQYMVGSAIEVRVTTPFVGGNSGHLPAAFSEDNCCWKAKSEGQGYAEAEATDWENIFSREIGTPSTDSEPGSYFYKEQSGDDGNEVGDYRHEERQFPIVVVQGLGSNSSSTIENEFMLQPTYYSHPRPLTPGVILHDIVYLSSSDSDCTIIGGTEASSDQASTRPIALTPTNEKSPIVVDSSSNGATDNQQYFVYTIDDSDSSTDTSDSSTDVFSDETDSE